MSIMNNQLRERRIGDLLILGGAVAFLIAAIVYCSGCAAERWVDSKVAMPLTKAACEVLTEQPNPPPGWVDVSCTWVEGIEAYLADVPDGGASMPSAATVKAPATLRMRITVPRAKQLAQAHPDVLQLPKGL